MTFLQIRFTSILTSALADVLQSQLLAFSQFRLCWRNAGVRWRRYIPSADSDAAYHPAFSPLPFSPQLYHTTIPLSHRNQYSTIGSQSIDNQVFQND